MLTLLVLIGLTPLFPAQARVASVHIARVSTPVAVLEDVHVRLAWPAAADTGELSLRARGLRADDLGYRWHDVHWSCPLRREAGERWRCDGRVTQAGGSPLRLDVAIDLTHTHARLAGGPASLAMERNAAAPDLTRINLVQVPVSWAQALVAQGWADARLKGGRLDGRLDLRVPERGPLQVSGPLRLGGLSLDTPDGSIAAEGLSAALRIDYRQFPRQRLVTLDGELRGGELLAGNAYIALPDTPVGVNVAARRWPDGRWELPTLAWDDGAALQVTGGLSLDPALNLSDAALRMRSDDLAPLQARYLSGWLGLAGLSDLRMGGALAARVDLQAGALREAEMELRDVDLIDGRDRFRLLGVQGNPVLSGGNRRDSVLRWGGGALHGLPFGAAEFPLRSGDGALALREAVTVPALGGGMTFEALNLHPPRASGGLSFDFGLSVKDLDIGRLATAMHWPAFQGNLSGRIPRVRYAEDRLDFDGVLTAHMFGGSVEVSGLSMERPFGTAPTLSADIALDDLDLQALTGVFGFGEITGALDGHIRDLRLVDWSPQGFDADLHTDPQWRGRQRISQRAVQDLSSVGGGQGLGSSLQAQALKLFDDFGYRRIGIRCRLSEEVCRMDGLGSAGAGFIIVEGQGLPRLTVVGYNHQVDWPTLVKRLGDVTRGESKPVFQ
ncbi:hypothetical protein [Pseudoxanthomonas sp. PXM04]|uniref:hypothetical protein n=1 Tax=Pseudoxanthomonas sp. PXM04 TaxID=2769297 RepID=UPI0017807D79|nr:hypothetical protein [Pseudoxanthomonas sp. PXM04]MBD9378363.1 hypothetical protein [Pseudoxanthomonas sp. PXM04]